MHKDNGIYVITVTTQSGRTITFRTDEWNEVKVIDRLTEAGEVILNIDRAFYNHVLTPGGSEV